MVYTLLSYVSGIGKHSKYYLKLAIFECFRLQFLFILQLIGFVFVPDVRGFSVA